MYTVQEDIIPTRMYRTLLDAARLYWTCALQLFTQTTDYFVVCAQTHLTS